MKIEVKEGFEFKRPPVWFVVVLVVTGLTGFAWLPYALSAMDMVQVESNVKTLVWIYPFYALLSVYLAYKCFCDRQLVAWILVVLVWVSLLAEILLVMVNIKSSFDFLLT